MELTLDRRPDGWLMAAEDGQSPQAELVQARGRSRRPLRGGFIGLRVQRGGLGCSSHWPDGGAMWGGGRPTPAEPRECYTLPPWCWRLALLIPPVAGGEESRDGHHRPQTGRGLRASDF